MTGRRACGITAVIPVGPFPLNVGPCTRTAGHAETRHRDSAGRRWLPTSDITPFLTTTKETDPR